MIVTISDKAEADLEAIADRIAVDNPARALSFVKELRQRCDNLADTPEAFPLAPRFEHIGIRRRVYGSYLIFYRVEATSIDVLHVLHGAMDYESVLFPEG
jgi:toxin ParE1/3/4